MKLWLADDCVCVNSTEIITFSDSSLILLTETFVCVYVEVIE